MKDMQIPRCFRPWPKSGQFAKLKNLVVNESKCDLQIYMEMSNLDKYPVVTCSMDIKLSQLL